MMSVFVFTLYGVSCRVVRLTSFVEEDGADVVACEYIYKSMIDSTQEALKIFKPMFTVYLLANIPQIVIAFYFVLDLVQAGHVTFSNIPWFGQAFSTVVWLIHSMLFVVVLSYYAGWLIAYNEKLKLTLHNILLLETDPVRCRDLKRFIRYIEARPFRFTVCKIVPIDWTLPVLILNVCVTYLIVAIQFTHVY